MKNISDTLKTQLKTTSDIVSLASGILALVTGVSNLFISILDSRYTLPLFCIGSFFLLRIIATYIMNAKKTVLQVEIPIYKKTYRKAANIIRNSSYLLFVFPIYSGITEYLEKINNRKINNSEFGLIVTSFSKSDDDDFSYRLFNTLNDNLQNIDSVNMIREGVFINSGNKGYLDSIKQTFTKNYFNRGLLVFGKRSEESKLFDCSIYIKNQSKTNIIYLQNPSMINFSIDEQSEIVSEFILGLLYYDLGDYARSKDKFQNALNNNASKGAKKFKAYCHFYIGNNLLNEKNSHSSITHYKEGLSYDAVNPFIHYNLAIALLNKKDSLNAFRHFNIANKLHHELDNPIKDFNQLINKKTVIGPKVNKEKRLDYSNNSEKAIVAVDKKANPSSAYSVIIINKKYGVLNSNGDTIIRCKYDFIDDYTYEYNGKRLFIVNMASKFGAVNSEGIFEIALKYSSKEEVYDAISEMANKKKSMINQF